MNIRFLETFVWAARLSSFRTAAERLNITQAAVSNRIASLEEDWNTRLFERDPREIRLTFSGRRMLAYAERMLELNREMMAASHANYNIAGVVRIGVIETVVFTWLTDFLQRVQEQYPAIAVQLSSESTQRLHAQMRNGELDIALQSDPLLDDGVRNIAGGSIAMGWVGRSIDWAAQQGSLGVAELAQHPIVTMNKGSQPYVSLRKLLDEESVSTPRIHCVSSISAIVRLVRAGFGVAVLPLAPVREEIDNGTLSIIECARPMMPQRLVLSYRSDATTDAIQMVAGLACEESARFTVGLVPPYGFIGGAQED
ncbi:LysR family transcriptional regulator [Herbaspirillum rubrisubalbicans]|uniref:LysR family transcriptional regulator n=2 Tax=Herbaspirillum rubrisubalbicans TaxID=80842 RepID=A0ABX9C071_9BURK|nr:LysR family transcriptional regulator [Herbaspirillum rubrisubalbicans]MCP1574810.1 DNA-binding transcriptional LysR family regulator [Herbaspirillum rubrisubalbicans]QJQ03283.1 LysR family transcriptional regulator [Herbaspirillum rubrisubalbicans Os34]RAM63514.1 LysR family transcriptional regulator [Herbaspirillum rubrisubalbicans]RAN48697.1 LysR family transcriptional regulator [Herbaspirillum rubrisubalbicans]